MATDLGISGEQNHGKRPADSVDATSTAEAFGGQELAPDYRNTGGLLGDKAAAALEEYDLQHGTGAALIRIGELRRLYEAMGHDNQDGLERDKYDAALKPLLDHVEGTLNPGVPWGEWIKELHAVDEVRGLIQYEGEDDFRAAFRLPPEPTNASTLGVIAPASDAPVPQRQLIRPVYFVPQQPPATAAHSVNADLDLNDMQAGVDRLGTKYNGAVAALVDLYGANQSSRLVVDELADKFSKVDGSDDSEVARWVAATGYSLADEDTRPLERATGQRISDDDYQEMVAERIQFVNSLQGSGLLGPDSDPDARQAFFDAAYAYERDRNALLDAARVSQPSAPSQTAASPAPAPARAAAGYLVPPVLATSARESAQQRLSDEVQFFGDRGYDPQALEEVAKQYRRRMPRAPEDVTQEQIDAWVGNLANGYAMHWARTVENIDPNAPENADRVEELRDQYVDDFTRLIRGGWLVRDNRAGLKRLGEGVALYRTLKAKGSEPSEPSRPGWGRRVLNYVQVKPNDNSADGQPIPDVASDPGNVERILISRRAKILGGAVLVSLGLTFVGRMAPGLGHELGDIASNVGHWGSGLIGDWFGGDSEVGSWVNHNGSADAASGVGMGESDNKDSGAAQGGGETQSKPYTMSDNTPGAEGHPDSISGYADMILEEHDIKPGDPGYEDAHNKVASALIDSNETFNGDEHWIYADRPIDLTEGHHALTGNGDTLNGTVTSDVKDGSVVETDLDTDSAVDTSELTPVQIDAAFNISEGGTGEQLLNDLGVDPKHWKNLGPQLYYMFPDEFYAVDTNGNEVAKGDFLPDGADVRIMKPGPLSDGARAYIIAHTPDL